MDVLCNDKIHHRKGKYSPVWSFFNVLDADRAACIICNGVFSYKSTTSNLRKHVERKHNNVRIFQPSMKGDSSVEETTATPSQIFQICSSSKKIVQRQSSPYQVKYVSPEKISNQDEILRQTLTEFKNLKNKTLPAEVDRSMYDSILQLFIKDFQPISIVEDEGFRDFITKLNPSFEIPNKKVITEILLPEIFEKCYENAREVAKCIRTACISTECWTSNNDESFLTVTAHFLDSDLNFKSLLISCSLLEENFTSESLATELQNSVKEWDLEDKVVLAVTSGEDYIANAVKNLLKWEHFGCFAHSLNKIISDALNFQPVEELITKVRHIVSFFRNDAMAASELHLHQVNKGIEPRKLKQDTPLLWNSTFHMIERLVELEIAVSSTIVIQESNVPMLQPDEWTVLKELTKILRSLEAVNKAVDNDSYMPASLAIVLVEGLFEVCRKLESCSDLSEITKRIVLKLKNGLVKRFSDIKKNPILSVCTFLDPRFKTIPFEDNGELVKMHVIDMVSKSTSAAQSESQREEDESKRDQEQELSVWEAFDRTAASSKLQASGQSRIQLEVERYIEDDLLPRQANPVEWWAHHRYNYPYLSELVSATSCCLATSLPFSRLFTKAGTLLMDRRAKLPASKVKLVFLNANQKLM